MVDTTISSLRTTLIRVPWAGEPPANGIMPPSHREFLVLEVRTKGGLTGMGSRWFRHIPTGSVWRLLSDENPNGPGFWPAHENDKAA